MVFAMSEKDINLLHQKASSLELVGLLESKLRMAAWWTVSLLLVVGTVVASAFIIVSAQIRNLEASKQNLARDINAQSTKEGILLALKDRVGIATRALDAAKPWGKLFPLIASISPAGGFHSVTVEESGRVSADLALTSIDQAVEVVTSMVILTASRSLRAPQLLSFGLLEDGTVQLTVSFIPVF